MVDDKILTFSRYFTKHKKRLRCPFCGSEMYFVYFSSYDSIIEYWACKECGLSINDKEDYTPEELKRRRLSHKEELKKEIEEFRNKLEELSRKLAAWGKYMSDKEKLQLLCEVLQGEKASTN